MSAALTAMFDRQGMDDSRHSVRSVESTSDNFYSTAPWEAIAPAATPAKGPTGTLRVIGRNSVNVNMAMAELLNSHGCVVEHSEQHRDLGVGCYFQRVEFKYETMRKTGEQLEASLHEVCGRLGLEFQLSWGTRPKRLCIFVSKYDHVLWEILLRPGQEKSANFPTSKAPLSVVFHSFRLILGRAMISRNGLEAGMLLSGTLGDAFSARGTLTLKRR